MLIAGYIVAFIFMVLLAWGLLAGIIEAIREKQAWNIVWGSIGFLSVMCGLTYGIIRLLT